MRAAVKDVGGLNPLPTWINTLWKSILPGLLALSILLFGANHFMLPDFNKDNREEKDINLLIKENPIIPNNHISSKPLVSIIDLPQAGLLTLKKPGPIKPDHEVNAPGQSLKTEFLKARRIPSIKPLVISQQDKLVTYLASLSLDESRLEATNWVLKKWSIDIILSRLVYINKNFKSFYKKYKIMHAELSKNNSNIKYIVNFKKII